MTSLALVVERARAQERNPGLDLFNAVAEESVRRAAAVLALAVSLDPRQLETVLAQLWQNRDVDWAEAVTDLARWPFVQSATSEWSVTAPFERDLAADFQEEDRDAFEQAHRVLAELEEDREVRSAPEDRWYIRGRIAYYLAGFDRSHSVSQFRESFVTAPVLDRPLARMWLTRLALRQDYLLGPQSRVVAFFRGFRDYVSGRRSEAVESFEQVIRPGVEDEYAAIAQHLIAVVVGSRGGTRGRQLLDDSLRLSVQMGLDENEVMARHTLVWSLIGDANRAKDSSESFVDDLHQAVDLAVLNLDRAREIGDSSLLYWTRRAAATARWLQETQLRTQPPSAAEIVESLHSELEEARRSALKHADHETATQAANDRASMYRDLGLFSDALDIVERHLGSTQYVAEPLGAMTNLAKTVGSLLRLTDDPVILRRVESILDEIGSRRLSDR